MSLVSSSACSRHQKRHIQRLTQANLRPTAVPLSYHSMRVETGFVSKGNRHVNIFPHLRLLPGMAFSDVALEQGRCASADRRREPLRSSSVQALLQHGCDLWPSQRLGPTSLNVLHKAVRSFKLLENKTTARFAQVTRRAREQTRSSFVPKHCCMSTQTEHLTALCHGARESTKPICRG